MCGPGVREVEQVSGTVQGKFQDGGRGSVTTLEETKQKASVEEEER